MLLAAAGGPDGEIFNISKDIQRVNVPMVSFQGGPRNTDRWFCLDVLKELKVSNDDVE